MKKLGAIIAGGQSRRFGSDKAAVLIEGKALIDHVADGLQPQVDALVVVGKIWPGMVTVPDWPAPEMGPLGGLCGALRYAQSHGFDSVCTSGCDTLPVANYSQIGVGDGPRVVLGQRLSGVWPSSFFGQLETHLACEENLSVRHWLAMCGAIEIDLGVEFHNLNRTEDLARFAPSTL